MKASFDVAIVLVIWRSRIIIKEENAVFFIFVNVVIWIWPLGGVRLYNAVVC